MRDFYDPNDHYWLAADGRLFGSARNGLAHNNDEAYQAWRSSGSLPTLWPKNEVGEETNAALAFELARHGITMAEV